MKHPHDEVMTVKADRLAAEVDARRARLAGNLDELSHRMQPANLLDEARDLARMRLDRMADDALDLVSDLAHDSAEWAKDHRRALAGGAVAAVLTAGAWWWASRRRPVPLYAAYDREDPDIMNDHTDEMGELKAKAGEALHKLQGEARHLGDKAGEAYYAARSRAAELSDEARERAAHAADVARVKAHEAAEAAREAADRAREAGLEAGRWAQRQPRENPATVVLVALAAGALIGALLPAAARRRHH